MWKEKLLTSLSEKYLPLIKGNLLPLGFALLGMFLISAGIILSSSKNVDDITFSPENKTPAQAAKIVVDISGAVIKPGVYTLSEGDRVKDALIAASGLSGEADRDWVSKNLNLAQKIQDGAKIFIPRVGEQVQSKTASGATVSSLININTATAGELDTLSGIGPVTAQKIIDNRPYGSIEELRAKKIVGQSVFDKIKDKITY